MRTPTFHLPHFERRDHAPRDSTHDSTWMWSLAVLLGALALVALLAAILGYAYPPTMPYPAGPEAI